MCLTISASKYSWSITTGRLVCKAYGVQANRKEASDMCYTVPLAGAVITSLIYHKKKEAKTWWLALMFYGGALFGVIDHLWNGELFLISPNIYKDLLLGIVITASILICWGIILILTKKNLAPAYNVNKEQTISRKG